MKQRETGSGQESPMALAGLSGGVERERGGFYEDVTLLFYILFRTLYDDGLEIHLESEEDATLHYSSGVTELIQCKKNERDGAGEQIGVLEEDYWASGNYTESDFRKWVAEQREGHCVIDMLKANPRQYYTALIFGNLRDSLKPLVPPPLLKLCDDSELTFIRRKWNEDFPPDFSWPKNSSALAAIVSDPSVLSRMRIIRTSSPGRLRYACDNLLEYNYQVISERVNPVRKILVNLIYERSTSRDKRMIQRGEIQRIILDWRSSQERWQDARKLLAIESGRSADYMLGENPFWRDFETGRFANRHQFSEAANALKHPGSVVVVSGAVGSGKTSLCRYLMYDFLNSSPNRSAFCLFALPDSSFATEADFLEQNMGREVLFVIEDFHLAIEEMAPLLTRFFDAQITGGVNGRLVLASKINYGHVEGLARGHATRELRNAFLVSLPNKSTEEVESLLTQLRLHGLQSGFSIRQLAEMSGGVIGVAMLIARSITKGTKDIGREGIAQNFRLQQQLAFWLWTIAEGKADFSKQAFREQIVPPFVIGAFGLPIYGDDFEKIEDLCRVGLVEVIGDPPSERRYRPADLNLAFLIQDQNRNIHVPLLMDWVKRYPQDIALALRKAAEYDPDNAKYDGKTLSQALAAKLQRDLPAVFKKLPLRRLSQILRILRTSDRALSDELFAVWVAPGNTANRFFWLDLFERAINVPELAQALEVIATYDLSAHRLKDLDKSLEESHMNQIVSLFEDPSSYVDDIGACLQNLRRCAPEFASRVFDRWTKDGSFQTRLQLMAGSPETWGSVLRYLERTAAFDRAGVYRFAEKLFPLSRLGRVFASAQGSVTPQAAFLSALHRFHPLLSARALAQIVQVSSDRLITGLRMSGTLDLLTQNLYLLSSVNRRLTIPIAYNIVDDLLALITAETDYAIAGGRIESVRRNVSLSLAKRMASALNKHAILCSLLAERRYIDRIGKFLYDVAKCDAELAAYFESHIDLEELLQATRIPRIRDIIWAIRGGLVAAARQRTSRSEPSRWERQRDRFLKSRFILDTVADRAQHIRNVSEIGFALTGLLDAGLPKLDVLRLVGASSYHEFSQRIQLRMPQERSVVHVAAGLYGLARFDVGIAEDAAKSWVEASETWKPGNNLVDLGCLLQILSAINPELARSVVGRYTGSRLLGLCTKEKNLGRLAVIISGLSHCSRKSVRSVTRALRKENWEQLYRSNSDLGALVHFAQVLRLADPETAATFIKHIVNNHSAEVLEFLRVQAHLMPIAHWLKLAANVGTQDFPAFVSPLGKVALEIREFDTQLRHLIEISQGLLETGQRQAVKTITDAIIAEKSQLASTHSPANMLVMVSKLLHLARRLSDPTFSKKVLSALDESQVELMVQQSSPILAGLMLRFMEESTEFVPDYFPQCSRSLRIQLVSWLAKEPSSISNIVALMIARAGAGPIEKSLRSLKVTRAWELGLLALLVEPSSRSVVLQSLTKYAAEVLGQSAARLLKSISDLPDIELGLVCAARSLDTRNHLADSQVDSELDSRMRAKSNIGTQWLLNRVKSGTIEPPSPHELFSILEATMLKSSYLPWESDLENLVDAVAFQQPHHRNELTMLPDGL